MRVKRSLAVGTLLLSAAALTGCQKPAPAISMWTGTNSINETALCWAFDSDQLQPESCAEEILQGRKTDGLAILEPVAGNTVGISVDKAVAEAGWTVSIAGQTITPTPLNQTYFRFTFPLGVQATGVPVQVVAGKDGMTKGIWSVLLIPATG